MNVVVDVVVLIAYGLIVLAVRADIRDRRDRR